TRYRLATRATNDIIWEWNSQTNQLLWTENAQLVFGYPPEEIGPDATWWDNHIHPEDRQRVISRLDELVKGNDSIWLDEYRFLCRDGSYVYVSDHGFIERDSKGNAIGVIGAMSDITKRKQAEEALRESDEIFSQFMQHSPIYVFFKDEATRSLRLSSNYSKMLGRPIHELLGKTMDEFFPSELAKSMVADDLRILREGRRVDVEEELDGRFYTTTKFPIQSEGRPRYLAGFTIDITERKQAEDKLAASEAELRVLFGAMHDVVLVFDREGRYVQVAPTDPEQLYKPAEEMLGKTVFEVLPPALAKTIYDAIQDVLQTHESIHVEYELPLGNGQKAWKDAIVSPLTPDAVFWIAHDITERKQAEEKIQRQVGYLSALRDVDLAITSTFDIRISLNTLLSQAVPLLVVDAAAVLLVNSGMNTLEFAAGLGFQTRTIEITKVSLSESHAGRVVMEQVIVQIPDLAHEPKNLFLTSFIEGENFTSYYGAPLIVKGQVIGVLEVFNRSVVERDSEWLDFFTTLAGQAAIAIDNARLFEDLQRTNLELEKRVQQRTAELERANRAKDEFLATMSHELRTPLNSILGLSEMLLEQRRGSLDDYQQTSLRIIESSGQHLLELINDVLDLSKIEAGKFDYYPQEITVDDLCRSSLAFVKALAAKKSITVTYEQQSANSRIFGDPRRLKQILVNLLTNAVKFTPENGQVVLRVHSDPEQDLIRFSVIDNGIGISHDNLKKLFKPFVQLDSRLNRQHEGTGLGLALVQRLADLHGGSIEVESAVGKGSRFTVNLPMGQNALAQNESLERVEEPVVLDQAEHPHAPSGEPVHHGTILLAEDNMANILTIAEYLESYGYEMVVVHDGMEAIRKAQEVNPDLILMDIQMPVMDGLEAMRRLRADFRFASTPVIALTALAMPGDRGRCLAAGASEYMSKPVSLKTLVKTIYKLLSS
ncbi:MAG TPA: PAS domain S-box protein, partial [Anaerolineales bacterium]|nr:PAS domain S-box protein [Anaerolineales bacterium]